MNAHISEYCFQRLREHLRWGFPEKSSFLDYLITWVIPECLCELPRFFSPSLFISGQHQMLKILYFKKQFAFLSFARQTSTWSLTLFLNQLHLYLHVLQENSVESTLNGGISVHLALPQPLHPYSSKFCFSHKIS